jgi:hypothetical protein
MKPQHQLMLRKVGKGKMFSKMKPEMRTHEMKPEDQSIKKITEDMEGMGLKKAMPKSVAPPKRKPLKFKL